MAFFGVNAVVVLGLWAGYRAAEKGRSRLELKQRGAAAPDSVRCVLCDRSLPRASTSDEVVVELERRIDADRAAVVTCLRELPTPDGFSRLYLVQPPRFGKVQCTK